MVRQEHEVASKDAGVPNDFRVIAPQISLPKGGGAIRGIGEKFSVNQVTGTGAMSVPIFTSPGRSGFGPRFALEYDSGAGNGPFGLGWRLSTPAITRKTDKGLPRYFDAEDSDVFVLSGAEDLVPVLAEEGGEWRRQRFEAPAFAPEFDIDRYRPRIEGLFARIERWTERATGDVHWRSISGDNVTTLYGRDAQARIADPADPTRVFSWLICESYDDRGNAMRYEYKAEDAANVDATKPQERNRLLSGKYAQRYLKRVRYANRAPRVDGEDLAARDDWLLEALFDYGEHDAQVPTNTESRAWPHRADPFSQHRATFEVRTQRLCRRVVMLHHFPEEFGGLIDYPVRSTDFTYREEPIASFLTAATQTGYARKPDGTWFRKSLPKVEFGYSEARIDETVRELQGASIEHLPQGLSSACYRWMDFDGEGVSGVLSEQGGEWRYKSNLGGGVLDAAKIVARRPAAVAFAGGRQQLMDLAGEGSLELVELDTPHAGFSRRGPDGSWRAFEPFRARANIDTRDRNLRFIDLTGDGRPDILVSEDTVFTWHESLAREGFAPSRRVPKPRDEQRGARALFADSTETVFLADMSGDGLTDLVRVRNGDICYWPNLGYGRFGAKVAMANAPRLDDEDTFDPRRVRLADIDGSGVSDLIYAGSRGVTLCFNQSGNSWSAPRALPRYPRVDSLVELEAVDLLGNGTACLVWSTPAGADARRPMRYIDLMGGVKPHLLARMTNNLGAETSLSYASSVKFYLEDRRTGRPWATKLPFPVHVLERVQVRDLVSDTMLVSTYRYRHGYFDRAEREFRGFAYVEQRDAESVVGQSDLPPVVTKTWYHTGAWLEGGTLEAYFKDPKSAEYFTGDAQAVFLPDTVMPEGLSAEEVREAARAMKGAVLRQEIYAEDGTEKAALPYGVSERSHHVKLLQPRGAGRHAVFLTHARESLTYHYERDPRDPRIGQELVLEVDVFGNVLKSASIGYARRVAMFDEQARLHATLTANTMTNAVALDRDYRTPAQSESRSFELTAPALKGATPLSFDAVAGIAATASDISYESNPTAGATQRRLIECSRTQFRRDDLSSLLPVGRIEPRAMAGESYKMAFTRGLLDVFSNHITRGEITSLLTGPEARYRDLDGDGSLWISSGRSYCSTEPTHSPAQELAFARDHFFLPHRYEDAFGHGPIVSYDAKYCVFPVLQRDAAGNETRAAYDFRALAAREITDANGNRALARFDALGLLVGTALCGKESGPADGDSFDDFVADPPPAQVRAYIDSTDPASLAALLLGTATTRVVYDLERVPACAASISRETHVSALADGETSKLQLGFVYSDGFGREAQRKMQAEPGPLDSAAVGGPVVSPRWVGTGTKVYDNKGNPIREYEPFFSTTPDFGIEQHGVSSTLFYDPASRVVATLHPNHTFEKEIFDAWQSTRFDANDTALMNPRSDEHLAPLCIGVPDADLLPTWHAKRIDGGEGAAEKTAAERAASHADTPTVTHADSMGRAFLVIADNGVDTGGNPVRPRTRTNYDIQGNQRSVVDALDRTVVRYDYDMLGIRIHQSSMEAGERWTLADALGSAIRGWNSRRYVSRTEYDLLRRPVRTFVRGGEASEAQAVVFAQDTLVTRIIYGDSADTGLTAAQVLQANLRGKVFRQQDSAGVLTTERYDFKGNCLASNRQLAADYKETPDWSASPVLESEIFAKQVQFDALNRVIAATTPDQSIYRPAFNEANLLEKLDVRLLGARNGTQDVWTPFVKNIDYDARGRRTRIEYANGATTTYTYEKETLRLTGLRTTRSTAGAGFLRRLLGGGDSVTPQIFGDAGVVQDLVYTYDAVGNITRIEDRALRTVFQSNARVDAASEYTYDAMYRLTVATGREHRGQSAFAVTPGADLRDYPFAGVTSPNDLQALRNYIESYEYDLAGNPLTVAHRANGGSWTRSNTFVETSGLEPARKSNRLSSSMLSGTAAVPEQYGHDVQGNVIRMPHLSLMRWDFRDQLAAIARQVVSGGTPETTYYTYDVDGQRVRKVTERQNGSRKSERVYLGGFEAWREFEGDGVTVARARESLHVNDDRQRIALVETLVTDGSAAIGVPVPLSRYQLGNHLGSASVELDESGALISYEEFSPYGTTVFQAGRSSAEVSLKRYRFTAKERDAETGLYCFGSRFYSAWLGRWVSCDPSGIDDGPNLYLYVHSRPIVLIDREGRDGSWFANTRESARQSAAGRGIVGFGYGVVQALTPGGTAAPTPPGGGQAFEIGQGLGQITVGAAELYIGTGLMSGGAGLVAGGGTLEVLSLGSATLVAVPAAAVGVVAVGVGAVVTVHGGSNILSGAKTIQNSLQSTGSGSPPPEAPKSPEPPKASEPAKPAQPSNPVKDPAPTTPAASPQSTTPPAKKVPNPEGAKGSPATQQQNKDIGKDLSNKDNGYQITGGGGVAKEKYFPGPGGKNKGSVRVDVTAEKPGDRVHVQTVDTRGKNSSIPDKREMRNAGKILKNDRDAGLFLIPKRK